MDTTIQRGWYKLTEEDHAMGTEPSEDNFDLSELEDIELDWRQYDRDDF
jgi:hypothetical protein